jgi:hypothetical protein
LCTGPTRRIEQPACRIRQATRLTIEFVTPHPAASRVGSRAVSAAAALAPAPPSGGAFAAPGAGQCQRPVDFCHPRRCLRPAGRARCRLRATAPAADGGEPASGPLGPRPRIVAQPRNIEDNQGTLRRNGMVTMRPAPARTVEKRSQVDAEHAIS